MNVVLADAEEAPLAATEADLKRSGATVLGVRTDVSKCGDVQQLARQTVDTFGQVHLQFNNADVAAG
jgi:NAD(P)-dependent dehydrogenase (short-subunit alcohol dehydrogenase family)